MYSINYFVIIFIYFMQMEIAGAYFNECIECVECNDRRNLIQMVNDTNENKTKQNKNRESAFMDIFA